MMDPNRKAKLFISHLRVVIVYAHQTDFLGVMCLSAADVQAVQADFMDAQATYDPNQVAAILHNHPYHIDTLLSMFELHRCGTFYFPAPQMIISRLLGRSEDTG
jgi:hypothetical protein